MELSKQFETVKEVQPSFTGGSGHAMTLVIKDDNELSF